LIGQPALGAIAEDDDDPGHLIGFIADRGDAVVDQKFIAQPSLQEYVLVHADAEALEQCSIDQVEYRQSGCAVDEGEHFVEWVPDGICLGVTRQTLRQWVDQRDASVPIGRYDRVAKARQRGRHPSFDLPQLGVVAVSVERKLDRGMEFPVVERSEHLTERLWPPGTRRHCLGFILGYEKHWNVACLSQSSCDFLGSQWPLKQPADQDQIRSRPQCGIESLFATRCGRRDRVSHFQQPSTQLFGGLRLRVDHQDSRRWHFFSLGDERLYLMQSPRRGP
jgi:hypothetical protein